MKLFYSNNSYIYCNLSKLFEMKNAKNIKPTRFELCLFSRTLLRLQSPYLSLNRFDISIIKRHIRVSKRQDAHHYVSDVFLILRSNDIVVEREVNWSRRSCNVSDAFGTWLYLVRRRSTRR